MWICRGINNYSPCHNKNNCAWPLQDVCKTLRLDFLQKHFPTRWDIKLDITFWRWIDMNVCYLLTATSYCNWKIWCTMCGKYKLQYKILTSFILQVSFISNISMAPYVMLWHHMANHPWLGHISISKIVTISYWGNSMNRVIRSDFLGLFPFWTC